ncbi:hypothetical protein WQ57_16995 [Mesobacillus campisalis]|uniref:Uncharacterized protein n=1 Tax=Mesobacillus campisalis TaxID=1408103 RepID=A0A0M2SQM8_9BACI|nr:hypothetical protein [Mesobacillus campisalis]KKK36849.1 hypothetical protein WQ57_16995 [Mesobacillus campisalis]
MGRGEEKWSSKRVMEDRFGEGRGKKVFHEGDGGPFWVGNRKKGPPSSKWKPVIDKNKEIRSIIAKKIAKKDCTSPILYDNMKKSSKRDMKFVERETVYEFASG